MKLKGFNDKSEVLKEIDAPVEVVEHLNKNDSTHHIGVITQRPDHNILCICCTCGESFLLQGCFIGVDFNWSREDFSEFAKICWELEKKYNEKQKLASWKPQGICKRRLKSCNCFNPDLNNACMFPGKCLFKDTGE